MAEINIAPGTRFSDFMGQLTPKDLGSKQHIRSGSEGQVLYSHSGFSGMTEKATTDRALKFQAGATQVKQLVANEYGNAFADRVFSNMSLNKKTRNIENEVTWKDLGRIAAAIKQEVELSGAQGAAKPAFGTAIQDSVNEKFGHSGDFSDTSKFEGGVHYQFARDVGRATYKIGGETLPKDADAAVGRLRQELDEGELKALTAVLHQGASLALVEQLQQSNEGFVKGLVGAGESGVQQKSSTYSLTGRGEDGSLKVTIEDFTPLGHLGRFGEDGMPKFRHLDPDASSLRTMIHGEVRPGKDPLFVVTQPVAYDLRMRDRE